MTPFETIDSVAAFLPEQNVDTDAIYPARYLLVMDREGLGDYLFRDRRYLNDVLRNDGFVLDREPFKEAKILIAGSGFGCGSSREQAVWALTGFGIRCVIAPSFGEIFAGNAVKNGLLTVTLPEGEVLRLGALAERGARFRVDLSAREVLVDGCKVAVIEIPDRQREALLNGWDEIDILLRDEGASIAAFQAQHRDAQPWLFQEPSS